ncbi:UNVERIFIED_CONTAM: hypothetical protein GTU68_014818 [Idotea baltica]|nr:hypothetical protein [Idotea baltica]
MDGLRLSVSHTTRAQRPGEENGVNYNFVSVAEFQEKIAQSDFLEHAEVFGNLYGTSESWVKNALDQGDDVILEIDWQGAAQIRKQIPETRGIFILPPSREILRQRLQGRGQDSEEVIEARMSQARDEISHYAEADYLIVNDDFEAALTEIRAIISAARANIDIRSKEYVNLISELLC